MARFRLQATLHAHKSAGYRSFRHERHHRRVYGLGDAYDRFACFSAWNVENDAQANFMQRCASEGQDYLFGQPRLAAQFEQSFTKSQASLFAAA